MNQSFRFVHAADLHLDSPLTGLESFEDAPVEVIRDASREALKKLVALCLEEKVDFLLIAGDIYDGEWKSMATGRFFADQMAKLAKAEIPVFAIKGNHDAASLISRDLVVPGVVTFDHKRPETRKLENLGVAIHGQSYSRRDVTENLSTGYPPAISGMFNIGMLHTCATGTGSVHAPYAPCSVEELVRKGYNYWALGHVHQRRTLFENPPIVFPGNIQGRHVKEWADEGKGATLVEVDDGSIASMTHIPLDVVRWNQVSVDVTDAETIEDVYIRAANEVRKATEPCEDRMLAVRITIIGSCPASLIIHRDLETFESGLRSYVQGGSAPVWVEEVRIRTRSQAPEDLSSDKGSLGDLLEFVRQSADNGQLSEIAQRFTVLREKIKNIAPDVVIDLDLENENLLRELLPDIEETILSIASGVAK